jgi:hypothetical protein
MERLIMVKTPTADDRRRLLELLVASDDGCTDALPLAHGFTLDVLISIVSASSPRRSPNAPSTAAS